MTVLAPLRRAAPPAMRALIRKELREYRNHRAILYTSLILPVVFMLLPLVNLVGVAADADAGDIRFAVGQAMFVFFLTPVIIPGAMSSYSVIGEKDQGTLEPVLTLPMTDRQFVHAKIVAIVTPAAIAACLVYLGYYLLGLALFTGPERGAALDPIWSLGVLAMAVPLSLYATLVGMTVSARAKDLRVAEQLAGLVIIPSMLPIALITFQIVPVGIATWGVFLLVVFVLDAALLALAYRMFGRERAIAMAS